MYKKCQGKLMIIKTCQKCLPCYVSIAVLIDIDERRKIIIKTIRSQFQQLNGTMLKGASICIGLQRCYSVSTTFAQKFT